MNIVLVTETYFPYISGISSSTHSIARFMADHGHKVTIVTPRAVHPDQSVDAEPDIRVVRTWAVPDPWYIGRMITPFPLFLWNVDRVIASQVDIVHVQEPTSLGFSALQSAHRRRIPVVGALHFSFGQVARALAWIPKPLLRTIMHAYIRWFYNKFDEIITPTDIFAQILRDIGVTRPIRPISNGVDTKEYIPGGNKFLLRQKFHLPHDSILYVVVGRLDRDKRLSSIISALPRVHKRIGVVIVGRGPEEQKLRELAQQLGVKDQVHWLGGVKEYEIAPLCQAVDGFVMMSVDEVQSIAMLQALSSGLPVIAADAKWLTGLVAPGENGYLVAPHDIDGLARRMNELAEDKTLRLSMGAKSRHISLHHDKVKSMARVETWYKEVIDNYRKAK